LATPASTPPHAACISMTRHPPTASQTVSIFN